MQTLRKKLFLFLGVARFMTNAIISFKSRKFALAREQCIIFRTQQEAEEILRNAVSKNRPIQPVQNTCVCNLNAVYLQCRAQQPFLEFR